MPPPLLPFNPPSAIIQPNVIQISNSRDPVEQPVCLPYSFDFATNPSNLVDLTTLFRSGIISGIQSIYFDNSSNTDVVTLTIMGSQQVIKFDFGAEGYLPILVPQPGQMVFSASGGSMSCQLLNVPMPAITWYPGQGPV